MAAHCFSLSPLATLRLIQQNCRDRYGTLLSFYTHSLFKSTHKQGGDKARKETCLWLIKSLLFIFAANIIES
jgi:hypothetical protein